MELRHYRTLVDEVGTLPPQHMLSALGEHPMKSHLCHCQCDVIIVEKLCIAQHLRLVIEYRLERRDMHPHLTLKLRLRRRQRGETVGVGLCQELHTPRLGELTEAVD